jgi:hypothetical protein
VYFHEAVHAMVARRLRLLPGTREHSWLQEGVANFLQLCLYPESLAPQTYPRHFSAPPDGKGKSFFKPIEMLLTGRISTKHYAQLASLVAYMLTRRTDWLRNIALGLSKGKKAEIILSECGTTFKELEEEWFQWGAQRFLGKAGEAKSFEGHFEPPLEWKEKPSDGERK